MIILSLIVFFWLFIWMCIVHKDYRKRLKAIEQALKEKNT